MAKLANLARLRPESGTNEFVTDEEELQRIIHLPFHSILLLPAQARVIHADPGALSYARKTYRKPLFSQRRLRAETEAHRAYRC